MTGSGLESIGEADVGYRVVIRRRLPGRVGPTGGPAYTDVLGVLERCAAGILLVRRSDATLVDIPIRDVARAKRIPPPPSPRRRVTP